MEEIKNSLPFIKEVAKYFMTFLETDFHRRKAPRRSISFHNKDNLLTGLNLLSKYPSFHSRVWKAVNQGFNNSSISSISKGTYQSKIPKRLLELVKLEIKNIGIKKFDDILYKVGESICQISALHKEDYEKAIEVSLGKSSQIIMENLISPFVHRLEKPIERLKIGGENSIYLMEEELTEILLSLIENKNSEIIKYLLAKEDIDVVEELKQVFDLKEVKNSIAVFFENFKVTDLFSELFEIERNRNIIDKHDFYLYFCDITFNKVKYPIFYIQFLLETKEQKISLQFDSRVYLNTKALEYIAQEYNRERDKKGNLKIKSERIIYIDPQNNGLNEILSELLNELVNFFELDSNIDTSDSANQIARNLWIKISNTAYIVLFDKSDEALVNDYEEIIQKLDEEDNIIVGEFNKLIEDFVHKNPKPFNPEIEDDWDKAKTSERLLSISPIPLNSEQLQILSAVRKNECKYITVEGPPGTGKSHTITAVVFDEILRKRSILILSDKKEALEVVEDKITETLNKIRHSKDFQNPILRLGKTGSNYNQILSVSAIEDIKNHYRAVRKEHKKLKADIEELKNSLKKDLDDEIRLYETLDIREIAEICMLESQKEALSNVVDFSEILRQPDSHVQIKKFRNIFTKIQFMFFPKERELSILNLLDLIGVNIKDVDSIYNFKALIQIFNQIQDIIQKVKKVYGEKIFLLARFSDFSEPQMTVLKEFINNYKRLRNPIFRYLFKGKKIAELDLEFKKVFPEAEFEEKQKKIPHLEDIYDIFSYILNLYNNLNKVLKIDCVQFVHLLIQDQENKYSKFIQEVILLKDDLECIEQGIEKYPETFKRLGVNASKLATLSENSLIKLSESDYVNLIRYIGLNQKLEKCFQGIPEINYSSSKKSLEELVTTEMAYIIDERLVKFYDYNRNDAKTLRNIIKKRQKFPRDRFLKLKEAFPCILAGIRDYADYIPLETELFDLLIIDEASQVSIAQAFPAFLRARKVLILGDKKQFSNVKSVHARTDTNRGFLATLEKLFRENVSNNTIKLERLTKFNIKTSILEFCEHISNYNTQLLKFFRGYNETISYSNKYFYRNSLQVMKIRGKQIDDVLKFSFIEDAEEIEFDNNTNDLEAEFIIKELEKIKESGDNSSVCIITPHTNQQKLLVEKISRLEAKDYFFDKLRLKIMTFDTCQGEERDIVFYSMVATEKSDRLWGVFIKDLSKIDIDDDGKIRAQRLNVGFSRAKECMHFVLSKPIEDFSGAIGEALRYYYNILKKAGKEPLPNQVDPNSPMEKKVLNWIMQTEFWKINFPENIFFKPQFELGKYLKQLDKTYNHPDYRVDFLLIYKNEDFKEQKIIIEYDGFKEHFENIYEVNEFNYKKYYCNDDVYRQKVLESYGYKFLRINKFNIGKDPIAKLNDRFDKLIRKRVKGHKRLEDISVNVKGLQNGEMKECPKCNKLRTKSEFKDLSLKTGYGRFCIYCKGLVKSESATNKTCPQCGAAMVLRRGKYGQFYGCSKFPNCWGTREVEQKGTGSYRSFRKSTSQI